MPRQINQCTRQKFRKEERNGKDRGYFAHPWRKSEPGGTRTHDLRIKSPLLYQLSYRLAPSLYGVRGAASRRAPQLLQPLRAPAPVRYGPGFKRPSKKTLRLYKAKQGPKLFTAEEIRRLLDAAGGQMKTMMLLGINCGYGNSDCGTLPLSAVDLESGWVDYPRPKTGIPRRCPLWPETVAALREALAKRKAPKAEEDAGLAFITKYGDGWAKDTADSPITKETRKLLDAAAVNGPRNFYTFRHTFRTVADEAKDQPSIDFIMGHESPHMATVYRERISDERLKAVAGHVRKWLFAKPSPKSSPSSGDDPAQTDVAPVAPDLAGGRGPEAAPQKELQGVNVPV